MNIETICKKCGPTLGRLSYGDFHTGLYCQKCNRWIKWVSKSELIILENGNTKLIEDINLIDEDEVDIKILEKQRDELNEQINKYYCEQTKKDIANNIEYIGKTFKRLINEETIAYYKILNVEENNPYKMNTLVFNLPIKSFKSKNMYEEIFSLHTESIGWFCNLMDNSGQRKREIDLYTEISNEEYLKTYNRWIEMIGEIVKNV